MKKKILFVIYAFEWGGTEKVLFNILNSLDKSAFDVNLLVVRDSNYLKESNILDVNIRTIFKNERDFKNKSSLYKKIYSLYRKAGSYILLKIPLLFNMFLFGQYDTYIAFEHGLSTLLMSKVLFKGKKIFWLHTDLEKNINNMSSNIVSVNKVNKAYQKAEYIFCVSEAVKNSCIDLFPNISKDKFLVTYNSLNKANILNLSNKSNPSFDKNFINIVSCGRLSKEKGHANLIKAHKRLIDQGLSARLYLLGDGTELKNLKQLSLDLNISDSVFFEGYTENPYPYIKNCDIVAMASLYEGFCLAIAEAIILNKCIVATRTMGAVELLQDKYGMLVDFSEIDLATGLETLILDKSLRSFYEQNTKKFDFSKLEFNCIEQLLLNI